MKTEEDPTQIALVASHDRIFQRVVPRDVLAEGEMWPNSPVQVDSRVREGFQLTLKDYLVRYTNSDQILGPPSKGTISKGKLP